MTVWNDCCKAPTSLLKLNVLFLDIWLWKHAWLEWSWNVLHEFDSEYLIVTRLQWNCLLERFNFRSEQSNTIAFVIACVSFNIDLSRWWQWWQSRSVNVQSCYEFVICFCEICDLWFSIAENFTRVICELEEFLNQQNTWNPKDKQMRHS